MLAQPLPLLKAAGTPGRSFHNQEATVIWKRILLSLALVFFLFLTFRVIGAYGYLGAIMTFNANPITELMSVDLILSLILVCVWMVRDARKHEKSYIPFLLLTAGFGVAGPLLYLLLRPFSLNIQRFEAIGLLVLLGGYSAMTHPLADLQTTATETDSVKGRALLERAAEAHGVDAWRKYATFSLTARDRWPGQSWWPEQDQGFQLRMLNGTFTSQAVLTDGKAAGEVWGIQAWNAYRQNERQAPIKPVEAPAPEISFYLPTLHYFAELPFRLLEAEHLYYQGRAEHRGELYELVLATWGDHQPNPEYDQYQLWINRNTHLIDMVHYTVRDAVHLYEGFAAELMKPLAKGTIHFTDYRDVSGVKVAMAHTITLPPPLLTRYPLDQHYFHRLEIQEAAYDKVPILTLLPLDIPAPSLDKKPKKTKSIPNDTRT